MWNYEGHLDPDRRQPAWVRDLDGLAFELSIVGDVLEPDNMNKDGQADPGEEL